MTKREKILFYSTLSCLVVYLIIIKVLNPDPTEKIKERFVHYRYDNIDYLYITLEKDIYDTSKKEYVVLNDSIKLIRDSIINYRKSTPFGKQLSTSLSAKIKFDSDKYLSDYKNYKDMLINEIEEGNVYYLNK